MGSLKSEDGEPLVPPLAVNFLSEHSDRAGLDSWLGALAVGADKRRFVGRWVAHGAEDTYIRSATRIVENCQRLAALRTRVAFRGGPDFLGEEETLNFLENFLAAQGAETDDIAWQNSRRICADVLKSVDPILTMSEFGILSATTLPVAEVSSSNAAVALPLEDGVAQDEEEAAVPEEDEGECLKDRGLETLSVCLEPVREELPTGFVIIRTRGGRCKRLHVMGGCFRIQANTSERN